jgi:hypothetical protein
MVHFNYSPLPCLAGLFVLCMDSIHVFERMGTFWSHCCTSKIYNPLPCQHGKLNSFCTLHGSFTCSLEYWDILGPLLHIETLYPSSLSTMGRSVIDKIFTGVMSIPQEPVDRIHLVKYSKIDLGFLRFYW